MKLQAIVFFLLFFPCMLFAKNIDIRVDFGFKIGYGFSSAIIKNSSASNGLSSLFQSSGVTGGLLATISHNKFASVQIELLYLQKAFKSSNLVGFFHTISIPILLRLNIPYGFFTNIGFAITAFLYKNLAKNLAPYSTPKDFEKLEYDIVFAFGFDFAVYKKLRMFIETRAFYTINNISHRYPEEIRHYGLQFYTGLIY